MRINISTLIFLFLSILSLFVGFFFGEDSSGSGGFISDYNKTWGYIKALQNNLFTLPTEGNWTVHTPLHYVLVSQLGILFKTDLFLRLIFLIICLSIPLIFFYCLKVKFSKLNINILIFLSLIIFLMPAFRSSVIWLNAHATALIFFLSFLYFFLVWEKNGFKNLITLNIFLQTIFLALAVYTRQYYAYFYLYLMWIYFRKFSFTNFIKISFFVLSLSIPGFILIFNEPAILKSTFDPNLANTILISSSIIFFYIIPFYLIYFWSLKKNFFKLREMILADKILLLSIFFLIIFLNLFFDYNYKIYGGGFFIKISYLFFNNNYFFLITSFFGLVALIDFFNRDSKNLPFIIIFLIGFSAYMIFQKYFEPIFFMIILLMMNNNLISDTISKLKNVYFLYFYFLVYLIVAIINDVFKITKILI